MSLYRHACGRTWRAALVAVTIDPRYAIGRCLCPSDEPWRLVSDPVALKEEGQARATSASLSWTVRAREWLRARPRGSTYTSEDLTADLGQPPSSGAVGSVMTWGARQGLHRKVGRRQATRPNQHAAELTVWEAI